MLVITFSGEGEMADKGTQLALSELLDALGFAAMARDVKTEDDPKRLSHYARIILKQAPQDKKLGLKRMFLTLRLI
jgi:hypothetical protein